MKRKYPDYEFGAVQEIEKTLSKKDKQILKDYQKYLSINASPQRVENITRFVLQFYDVSETSYYNWTNGTLEGFLSLLNNSGKAVSTIKDTKKNLMRLLKWYYDDWKERFNNFDVVQYKKKDKSKQKELLTPKEVNKLLRGATSIRHTAIINLLWESGIRPNELCRLKWKHFDPDNKKISVHSTKNNSTRIIFLDKAVHSLKDWKQKYCFPDVKKEDWIFPNPNDRNKNITIQSLHLYISELGKKILDKKISPYNLRHTRLNLWFNSGMNPKDYEKVADHSHSVALAYYQQSDMKRLKEKFDEIYGLKELTKEEKQEIQNLKEKLAKYERKQQEIDKKVNLILENGDVTLVTGKVKDIS